MEYIAALLVLLLVIVLWGNWKPRQPKRSGKMYWQGDKVQIIDRHEHKVDGVIVSETPKKTVRRRYWKVRDWLDA